MQTILAYFDVKLAHYTIKVDYIFFSAFTNQTRKKRVASALRTVWSNISLL